MENPAQFCTENNTQFLTIAEKRRNTPTSPADDPNIACRHCAACNLGRVNLCHNLQAIGIHRNGGLAEYAATPQNQAFVLPLSLEPLHGAFCEPLACCLHGVDLAGLTRQAPGRLSPAAG